ncbi:FecR family protein [Chitinophaga silvatica]|uniref:FecR family protein n=1 Tax=Chitinophaga silvatica TaxID=2282649 RepID=A0A3E1Y588_9BACT|nr:FecR family protein [Chitinophaga silvatica]RFS19850.1 FecR family protein [Chitinophaga silvatica]
MDTEQIKILLERYNQGNCSPEEAAIVDQWFDNISKHQTTKLHEKTLDNELTNLKLAINQHIAPAAQKAKVRTLRYWWYAAAAVAIGAIGIVYMNQHSKSAGTTTTIIADNATGTKRVVKDGFVELTVAKAHTEQVTLEDGSTVTLNANSKLRYPEHFDNRSRTIYLEEGEAFFDVATDQSRQFTVLADNISTTALGTSFNIRAYSRENKVTVALISGKVKVDQLNKQNSLILLPSEQISYDRLSLNLVKTVVVKPTEITAWKQGYLIFKDAPYNEVVTGLENRFGVTVVNNSDTREWNYNGSFKNESIKDVMDVICQIKSLSYTIKNDTVYLQNKN